MNDSETNTSVSIENEQLVEELLEKFIELSENNE